MKSLYLKLFYMLEISHFDIEKITENIDAIVQGNIEPLRKLKRE